MLYYIYINICTNIKQAKLQFNTGLSAEIENIYYFILLQRPTKHSLPGHGDNQ